MRRWLAALALLPIAGCLGGDADCFGTGSGNAPLVAFLRGREGDVVGRVADAFADPLDGGRDGATFTSSRGGWRAQSHDGEVLVNFFGTGDPWLDEEHVRAGLQRLGVDVASLQREAGQAVPNGTQVRFWQTFQGAPIASVDLGSLPDSVTPGGSDRHFTNLDVGGLRELSAASAPLSPTEAVAAAQRALACTGTPGSIDAEHLGFDVHADSVVRTAPFSRPAPGQHCDPTGGHVLVDAVTGAALAIRPWGCA